MIATRPSILLVEDDPGDVELLQLVLEEAGGKAELEVASTGAAAMELLHVLASSPEDALPDFVLLDLNLPVIRGHEILAFMKQEPVLEHIPVAVLTSSGAPSDRERCSRQGCIAYLVKPGDLRGYRDLARVIVRMLEGLRPA